MSNGVVFPYVPDQRVTLRISLNQGSSRRYASVLEALAPPPLQLLLLPAQEPGRGWGVGQDDPLPRQADAGADRPARLDGPGRRTSASAPRGGSSSSSSSGWPRCTSTSPRPGVYDSGTGLAIDAYHRLLRWGVSQSLDGKTISYLLNGWGEFKVRFPDQGSHAEGNLATSCWP